MAACMPEPGHADPLSDMEAFDIRTDLKDMTNDLVPRNDRIACGDLTVCDMQIGTTDTASDDPAEKLAGARADEHTSELQSLLSTSYAVFCLKKNNKTIAE